MFVERKYVKDEDIIVQDDEGDFFCILEEGTASVIRSYYADGERHSKEIAQLKNDAAFGEFALMTNEPRSATVRVTSETAKVLLLRKAEFDQIVQLSKAVLSVGGEIISVKLLEQMAFYSQLPSSSKQRLKEAMTTLSFPAGTYICREGTVGNTFYIIIQVGPK